MQRVARLRQWGAALPRGRRALAAETAAALKEVRRRSGAPWQLCLEALKSHDSNVERALSALRAAQAAEAAAAPARAAAAAVGCVAAVPLFAAAPSRGVAPPTLRQLTVVSLAAETAEVAKSSLLWETAAAIARSAAGGAGGGAGCDVGAAVSAGDASGAGSAGDGKVAGFAGDGMGAGSAGDGIVAGSAAGSAAGDGIVAGSGAGFVAGSGAGSDIAVSAGGFSLSLPRSASPAEVGARLSAIFGERVRVGGVWRLALPPPTGADAVATAFYLHGAGGPTDDPASARVGTALGVASLRAPLSTPSLPVVTHALALDASCGDLRADRPWFSSHLADLDPVGRSLLGGLQDLFGSSGAAATLHCVQGGSSAFEQCELRVEREERTEGLLQ